MVFRVLRATPKLHSALCFRMFASLPSHTKLALPNLSPTMSKGTIAKWTKKEGDSFKAGEAIADIETDKATVAFEMLENGFLAKILVAEGTKDVPLGTPIAIMVENKEDIEKFKDFSLDNLKPAPKVESKPVENKPEIKIEAKPQVSYPSHTKLALPNLSPTMSKGNIAKWLKKEGDSFKAGEAIADIETDKATVAFEMLEAGYLAKIIVAEGAKDVPLGTIIAVMCENKEDVPKFHDYSVTSTPSIKKEAPVAKQEEKVVAACPMTKKSDGRIFISPEAKKLAEQNKLNISTIKGTGFCGRIILADVEEALGKTPSLKHIQKADFGTVKYEQSASPIKVEVAPEVKVAAPVEKVASPKAKPMAGLPDFTDVELTKYKIVTAERLTQSKQQIPHYYVEAEMEMDKIMALREYLNKNSPYKITINDMLIKACSIACLKVPLANSSWMNTHIRQYKDADISVAVQTPIGLITPIVYRANLKGLGTIASEMKDLAARAKDNKLKPEEFMGGTFTISNAGMYGISNLVPIVNPPQSAILGVGATIKRVVPNEGSKDKPYKLANVMKVSLSCDHRVIDGATGSEYLKEFKRVIENPELMML